MKYFLTALPIVSVLAAGPALAAGNACTTAPKTSWKSQSVLKAQLESQGLKVRQIKTEGGCYEVYAVDAHGKRVNAAYNAETLKKAGNAEAGEK